MLVTRRRRHRHHRASKAVLFTSGTSMAVTSVTGDGARNSERIRWRSWIAAVKFVSIIAANGG